MVVSGLPILQRTHQLIINNLQLIINKYAYLCTMTNTNNEIIATALKNLNISQLNPMQETSLKASNAEGDMILLSPTGSGKTVAFLLPLLTMLSNTDNSIQALIVVPSRELALQIESVIKKMATPWKCCCCYGSHPIRDEKRSIEGNHPAIIVGTPGRLLDHIYKGNFDPTTIHTLVIDEFDKSLEFGFHDEMIDITNELTSLSRRILLSATDADEIPEFVGLERAIRLDFLRNNSSLATRLEQRQIISPSRDKFETLYKLLCTLGSTSSIVFCNHREACERIGSLLEERGLYSERFHGGMEQPDRERALYKFRNGSCHVLVSTDLAARGLDIPEVGHVIHYHLPIGEDAFTHRNGRTARWESTGVAYILLSEEETPPRYISEEMEIHTLPEVLPRVPQPLWTTLYIGRGRKEKISRMDVAGFLYKKGGLTRDEVGQIDIREHYGFATVRRDCVKSLLKLIRGEKIKGQRVLIEEANY